MSFPVARTKRITVPPIKINKTITAKLIKPKQNTGHRFLIFAEVHPRIAVMKAIKERAIQK